MEYRRLGTTDIEVSVVGLGCNNFGGMWDAGQTLEQSQRVVDAALDAGVTLFDTAPVYGMGGSETHLGEALGKRRGQAVIATKFGHPGEAPDAGGKRAYIRKAVEGSLARLKTDWIDLYQLHIPDKNTPIEETLETLEELRREGKIRAIGSSHLPASGIAAANHAARDRGLGAFATAQDEYSLLSRGIETELAPLLTRERMGLLPYFPLANGVLTGKYGAGAAPADSRFAQDREPVAHQMANIYLTPQNQEIVGKLSAFCAERGRTLVELAFSWLTGHPFVASVIAGASRAEQVTQNAKAAGWRLTADESAEVDRLTRK